MFASICMLRVYSLNYFLHFAQVWGTSAEQIPLVGCSQDPRKRAASPAELTSWGDRCSLMWRSDGESFSIFFTSESRSDYILKPLLLWEKPALWIFVWTEAEEAIKIPVADPLCSVCADFQTTGKERSMVCGWSGFVAPRAGIRPPPSATSFFFFFFLDEQQTGWKTLKRSDYGSGSQSEAVEEKETPHRECGVETWGQEEIVEKEKKKKSARTELATNVQPL